MTVQSSNGLSSLYENKEFTMRTFQFGNEEDVIQLESFAKNNAVSVRSVVCFASASLFAVYSAEDRVQADFKMVSFANAESDFTYPATFTMELEKYSDVTCFQEMKELQLKMTLADKAGDVDDEDVEWASSASGVEVCFLFTDTEDSVEFEDEEVLCALLRNACENYSVVVYVENAKVVLAYEPGHSGSVMFKGVEYFVDHLKEFLPNILATSSSCTRSSINLVSQKSISALVERTLANMNADILPDLSLWELFHKQALLTPHRSALCDEWGSMSYDELMTKAQECAVCLSSSFKECYGRELTMLDAVASSVVCGRKRIISLLAILRTGAVYVPIDASLSAGRLSDCLTEAKAVAVVDEANAVEKKLTNRGLRNQILFINYSSIMGQTPDPSKVSCLPLPSTRRNAHIPAYRMLTSGSSGKPKCVNTSHKGVYNLVHNLEKEIVSSVVDISEKEKSSQCGLKIAQATNITFDVSLGEIFTGLFCGHELVLVPFQLRTDPTGLASFMRQHCVQIAFFTPSLLSTLKPSFCSSLKVIVSVGESCPEHLFKAHLPYRHVINAFGPTETTIFESLHRFNESDHISMIGSPISNCQMLILDGENRMLPVGVRGEIYVASPGITLGYEGRQELNSKMILENPFARYFQSPLALECFGKMYKSGDSGRQLKSGKMEYFGRLDNMVKLRGNRMELEDVESSIELYDNIEKAVAKIITVKGTQHLVAYLKMADHLKFECSELRAFLKTKLPRVMIPSYFVPVQNLALSRNGKVCRKSLPEFELDKSFREIRYVAPSGKTETTIARIWKALLQCGDIGREDNFFALGGQSLLAAQCIEKLNKELRIALPVSSIFENAELYKLARAYESAPLAPHSLEVDPTAVWSLDKVHRSSFGSGQEGKWIPATKAQCRLWYMHLTEDPTLYNMPEGRVVDALTDTEKFATACQELADRHPSTRTIFADINGVLMQRVDINVSIGVDFRTCLSEEALYQSIEKDISLPFDLENGPLTHVYVYHYQGKAVIIMNQHHIVSDGISSNILFRDLAALYDQKTLLSADSSYDFLHFAVWENSLLKSFDFKREEAFWKKELEDVTLLNLKTDYPRSSSSGKDGVVAVQVFGNDVLSAVKQVAMQNHTTPFNVLLSSLGIFLQSVCSQDDFIIGIPVSSRASMSPEATGYFVNTLPLRFIFDGNNESSLSQCLSFVSQKVSALMRHQLLPLDRIMSLSDVERDPSRSPLFDVVMTCDRVDDVVYEKCGTVRYFNVPRRKAKFDLVFNFVEFEEHLECNIVYNCSLFSPATIQTMQKRLAAVLHHVTKQKDSSRPLLAPDICISSDMLAFSRSYTEVISDSKDHNILELFHKQVLCQGERIAVNCKDVELTYQQLDEESDALARQLISALRLASSDFEQEQRIGVCLEKSMGLVITILAVLKSGMCYVPLDPNMPENRLIKQQNQAEVDAVIYSNFTEKFVCSDISCAKLRLGFSVQNQNRLSFYDSLTSKEIVDKEEDQEKIPLMVPCDSVAFILYTSGSTGMPKGIQITHANFAHMILNFHALHPMPDTLPLRGMLYSAIGFDLHTWEIFSNLCFGGELFVLPEDQRRNPEAVHDFLQRHRITRASFTPSIASRVKTHSKTFYPKQMILGGEFLSPQAIPQWMSVCDKVINVYGPAECTVFTTSNVLSESSNGCDVGRSLPGLQVFILDSRSLKRCPVGVEGELCISGEQVARGYFADVKRTSRSFVEIEHPDSLHSELEAASRQRVRIYRTGDVGVLNEDGSFSLRGRNDDQVKINGVRIEIGDIERNIESLNCVDQCTVVCFVHNEKKRLAAFYTAAGVVVAEEEKVRDLAFGVLPPTVVPSLFVRMEKLPKTSNDKVHRRLLLDMCTELVGKQKATTGRITARTKAEEILVGIWKGLLGVDDIGINDDFFALGGDSIISIQVLSKAKKEGIVFKVKDLVRYPTIDTLPYTVVRDELLKGGRGDDDRAAAAVDCVEGELVRGEFELTPIQAWFFDRLSSLEVFNQSQLLILDNENDYDREMVSVGEEEEECVKEALDCLVHVHDSLRLRYKKGENGEWRQFYENGEVEDGEGAAAFMWPLLVVSLKGFEEAEQLDVIKAECEAAERRVDFREGKLCQAVLFKGCWDGKSRLYLCVHHLVVDGISWRILLEDLVTALGNRRRAGESTRLGSGFGLMANKTTPFMMWENALQAVAKTHDLEMQTMFWNHTLSKAPSLPMLSLQDNCRHIRVGNFHIAKDLTEKGLSVSKKSSVNMEEMLLFCHLATLNKWFEQNTVVLYMESHGRDSEDIGNPDVDISRTVGWFTNIYPAIFDLAALAGDECWSHNHQSVLACLDSVKLANTLFKSNSLHYNVLQYYLPNTINTFNGPKNVFNYLGRLDFGPGCLTDSVTYRKLSLDHSSKVQDNMTEANYAVVNGCIEFDVCVAAEVLKSPECFAKDFENIFESLVDILLNTSVTNSPHMYKQMIPKNGSLTPACVRRIAECVAGGEDNVENVNVVAPNQSSLLFHTYENASSYIVQHIWTLENSAQRIEIDMLRETLEDLVRLHKPLRAIYLTKGVLEPVQIILKNPHVPVHIEAFQSVEDFQSVCEALYEVAFDLGTTIPVRFVIASIGDTIRLVMHCHHIAIDGWSLGLFQNHLNRFYKSKVDKETSFEMVAVPRMEDYVDICRSTDMSGPQQYWKEHLKGALPVALPTLDMSQCVSLAKPVLKTDTCKEFIDMSDISLVSSICQGRGLQMSAIFHYAYAKTLKRDFGGVNDENSCGSKASVTFGTVVSGRGLPVDNIVNGIGYYANVIPIQVPVGEIFSVDELRTVQGHLLEGSMHGYLSLSKVFRFAGIENFSGLVSSALVYQNVQTRMETEQSERNASNDSLLNFLSSETKEMPNFPLTVSVEPSSGKILLEWDTDIFGRKTMISLAKAFKANVESIFNCLRNDISESSLSLSQSCDLSDVMELGKGESVSEFANSTVLDSLRHAVQMYGSLTAVEFQDEKLSYLELDMQSNAIAKFIHDRYSEVKNKPLDKGSPVGVNISRSIHFYPVVFGVWKAGCILLPLDPTYPCDRLEYAVKDTQALMVITQPWCEKVWRNVPNSKSQGFQPCEIVLEKDIVPLVPLSRFDLSDPVTVFDEAYRVYSSGTTGNPKGMRIAHRGMLSVAYSTGQMCGTKPGSSVMQLSSMNFDAIWLESLQCLMKGGRVVMATQEARDDPTALGPLLLKHRVEQLIVTPSYLALVPEPDRYTDLKLVCPMGEVCSARTKTLWGKGRVFCNAYGPSEITIANVMGVKTQEDSIRDIGRPIANCRVYIVDENMNFLPRGAIGELLISTSGLSLGYVNLPEETKKRFLPNPFFNSATDPDYFSTIYRSGDLVRWIENDCLEYVGRKDQQVKIRGNRIELGEIEKTMEREVAGIKQAAVVAQKNASEDGDNGNFLVAFYTVASDDMNFRLSESAIFSALRNLLPAAMIPSVFQQVEAFEITANGKINKKIFPKVDLAASRTQDGGCDAFQIEPPQTDTEKDIAEVWKDMFGLDHVDRNMSFFGLGGHSLLAAKCINTLNSRLSTTAKTSDLFNSPILKDMAALYDCLKSDIRSGDPQCNATIPARDLQAHIPLSEAQMRLWYLHRNAMDPSEASSGHYTYNMPVGKRIRGKLDMSALKAACEHLVKRHEILRTTFAEVEEGKVVQVIHENITSPFFRETVVGSEESAICAMERDLLETFDIEKSPAVRFRIYRFKLEDGQSTDTIFVIDQHHIISDGESAEILFKDLFELYDWLCKRSVGGDAGTRPVNEPLQFQYADYALIEEKKWKETTSKESATYSFWKHYLKGVEAVPIPTDYTRPALVDHGGDTVTISPSNRLLLSKLKSLASRAETTVFNVLMSAFYVLVSKLSSQKDVVVGFPSTSRPQLPGFDNVAGFFVNTLPFRIDFNHTESFENLLQHVSNCGKEISANSSLPLSKIVEASETSRELSRMPLFDLILSLNYIEKQTQVRDVVIEEYELPALPTAKYDLSIMFNVTDDVKSGEEAKQDFSISINFRKSLFKTSSVIALARRMECLLERIAVQPDVPINGIEVTSFEEKDQLLKMLSAQRSHVEQNANTCRKGTFFDQWQRSLSQCADLPALYYNDQSLTHQQLREITTASARRIRSFYFQNFEKELPRETVIAVCMDKSTDLLIAILSILKAGAAYVPLDPNSPEERNDYILTDSGASIVLYHRQTNAHINTILVGERHHSCFAINSDAENLFVQSPFVPGIADEERVHALPVIAPKDLAYIIYTSGSTGHPKGVLLTHIALTHVININRERFRMSEYQRFLFYAAISFDSHVFELFPPVACGKELFIAPESIRRDPEELFHFFQRNRIQSTILTPSVFSKIPFIPSDESIYPKQLIMGGEAWTLDILKPWESVFESVINAYGPTEASVTVLSKQLVRTASNDTSDKNVRNDHQPGPYLPISLGKPYSGVQCFVLDEQRHLCPPGVHGELYVSGDIIARGYVNRPEKTASSFLPNPFSGGCDEYRLMYKTGDMVKFNIDGSFSYIGRNDDQVKINGVRIELGEIEQVMMNCDIGEETIEWGVAVCDDKSGPRKRIVSFYSLKGGALEKEDELRFHEKLRREMSAQLPPMFVPSVFFGMSKERIPLTPNGKVDTRVLLKMVLDKTNKSQDAEHGDSASQKVTPCDALESELLQIIKDVLKVEDAGVMDDFFALGGDSISSIQVIAKAKLHGILLKPKDFIRKPVIRCLCSSIRNRLDFTQPPEVSSRVAVDKEKEHHEQYRLVEGLVNTTPIQRWYLQNWKALPVFNQSEMLVVNSHNLSTEPISSDSLKKKIGSALHKLAAHHDALRLRFEKDDDEEEWRQFHDNAAVVEGNDSESKIWPVKNVHFKKMNMTREHQFTEMRKECYAADSRIDFRSGKLLDGVLFHDWWDQRPRLFLTIHHLVVDGVSWRIILEDFAALLKQEFAETREFDRLWDDVLPPKSTSFQAWSNSLREHFKGRQVAQQKKYWSNILQLSKPLAKGPY
eukprot:Nk52_evm22s225 gene=Nk52_evmTU22s225